MCVGTDWTLEGHESKVRSERVREEGSTYQGSAAASGPRISFCKEKVGIRCFP